MRCKKRRLNCSMSWRCSVDKPEEQLVTGQVGTVVELLAPDVYEVEFLDSKGRTIAVTELKRADLLLLQHETVFAA
jgi:Domain of unknown function (DUF4926)